MTDDPAEDEYVDLELLKTRHPDWAPNTRPAEPLDEIEIEYRYKRSGRGDKKPYLVISLDALEVVLLESYGKEIGDRDADAAHLLQLIADRGQMAGHAEAQAVVEFYYRVDEIDEHGEDESGN